MDPDGLLLYMEPPPSPARWSRIPFDILDSVDARAEKRQRISIGSETCIRDIPEPILASIFSSITDTRTRNAMALVCLEWYNLERATRKNLCLRGNVNELCLVPRSYQAVECLDLSNCSPWGYSLFQSIPDSALIVGHSLKNAFPRVRAMTIYVRDSRDIDMVALLWPELLSLKLVRWHQRPTVPEESSGFGMEFRFLMQSCKFLKHLDLSEFYCWTEDIPPSLQFNPLISMTLRDLNLLKVSVEGFKASELEAITSACSNLEDLKIVLVLDTRYLDFVSDDHLLDLGRKCKKLKVLHLVDNAALFNTRGDLEGTFSEHEPPVTKIGLVGMFQALPQLEDLAVVLSQDLRNSIPILEALAKNCKQLRSLSLGNFHGLCQGTNPDGIALCAGLQELVIRNCFDLDDTGLRAIGSGNKRLQKLGLHGCNEITGFGLRFVTRQLKNTLVDVQVSCCCQLNVVTTLWALEPIQSTIKNLHIDYLPSPDFLPTEIDSKRVPLSSSNVDETKMKESMQFPATGTCTNASSSTINSDEGAVKDQTTGLSLDLNTFDTDSNQTNCDEDGPCAILLQHIDGNALVEDEDSKLSLSFRSKEWSRLKSLSLWMPLGELLLRLPEMGLLNCPVLKKISLKVEGDSRECPKPKVKNFGIDTLGLYPMLSKLIFDCSGIIGYALSAPQGHMELSLWDRWYLIGIDKLSLQEIDYWPPQDRDANRRGLSLPSAGLISQCRHLRKLILHGTINEHLLNMFVQLSILRDMHLRMDYYPAPENVLDTEMRGAAFLRFQAAHSVYLLPG